MTAFKVMVLVVRDTHTRYSGADAGRWAEHVRDIKLSELRERRVSDSGSKLNEIGEFHLSARPTRAECEARQRPLRRGYQPEHQLKGVAV